MPFTGEEAAAVLPMSSRMLTSSFICLSSESDEAVHANRPSAPWATSTLSTLSFESAPGAELMYSLRAFTALVAVATLKVCARAAHRVRLSLQNEGDWSW